MMDNIKLFVISNSTIPKMMGADHYLLQTGSIGKSSILNGCLRDDTGDNISERNPKYAELTGVYWIWKNQSAPYLGILQYKRRFGKEYGIRFDKRKLVFGYHILNSKDMMRYFERYDAIVSEEILKEQTVDQQFRTSGFSYRGEYPGIVLDATEKVLERYFPQYLEDFKAAMQSNILNPHNMMVVRQQIFHSYCEFLFPILEKLDEYIPVGYYDEHYNRMYGWLAERLFGVFLRNSNISYIAFPVIDIEHTTLTPIGRFRDLVQKVLRRIRMK